MQNISPYLLLVITVLACTIVSTSNNIFSKKQPSFALKSLGVSVISLVSGATLFIWDGFGEVSRYSLITGVIFGALVFVATIMIITAFSLGPWSYTFVLICLSMLIPSFSGAIFWGETIKPIQYLGTAFVVVCVILSVEKKEQDKDANWKWLTCTAAAFLTNGGIGIMQKVHQTSDYADELSQYLIVSFIAGAILSGITALIFWFKDKKDDKQIVKRTAKEIVKLALLFVIAGVCTAVNHKLNLYLSGVLPAAEFFPIVNGGPTILASITAVVFFKERLTKKQSIGLLIGIAAIFLLTI